MNHLELLDRLVRFKTVSENQSEVLRCLMYIEKYIKDTTGIKGEFHVFSGKHSLIIRKARRSALSLIGHIDVVPGTNKQFKLVRTGNKLIGRGVLDMKGPNVSLISAFCTLANNSVPVELILTSDEEVGGKNGILALVTQNIISPKIAIIPDGLSGFNTIVKQKGPAHIQISARGSSCHASRPWMGVNAFDQINMAIGEIRQQFNLAKNDEDWLPTATPTIVMSNSAINQVPNEAVAHLDIRITENETDWKKIINDIAEKNNCTISEGSGDGKVFRRRSDQLIQSLWESAVERITGKDINNISSCSASDARHLPKNCFTIITSLSGGGAHGEKEWIKEGSMEELTEIINNFATNLVANT